MCPLQRKTYPNKKLLIFCNIYTFHLKNWRQGLGREWIGRWSDSWGQSQEQPLAPLNVAQKPNETTRKSQFLKTLSRGWITSMARLWCQGSNLRQPTRMASAALLSSNPSPRTRSLVICLLLGPHPQDWGEVLWAPGSSHHVQAHDSTHGAIISLWHTWLGSLTLKPNSKKVKFYIFLLTALFE